MAQPDVSRSSDQTHSVEPLLIPAIVEATGLPMEYTTTYLQTSPIGGTRNAKIRKSNMISIENYKSMSWPHKRFAWAVMGIPACIVEELRTMPYSQLLGQGVLIRDALNNHTSFITIAEAAFVQLNGLYELLECLLIAISHAINNELRSVLWDLSWKPEALVDYHLGHQSMPLDTRLVKVTKGEAAKKVVFSDGESDVREEETLSSNPRGHTEQPNPHPSPISGVLTNPTTQKIDRQITVKSPKIASVVPDGRGTFYTTATNTLAYMGRRTDSKSRAPQHQSLESSIQEERQDKAEPNWQIEKEPSNFRKKSRQDRASKKSDTDTGTVKDEPKRVPLYGPLSPDWECPLYIRHHSSNWDVVAALRILNQGDDINLVLRWLQVILTESPSIHPEIWSKALLRDDWSLSFINLKFESRPSQSSCWRRKLCEGRVVRTDEHRRILQPYHLLSVAEDGLLLTAACLWSLFDNTLRRVHGCHCTFRSEGGDYLQYQYQQGVWFLWHVLDATAEICDGKRCQSNFSIALTAEENGERLYMTTPCVLGWPAETRKSARQPIATKLSISDAMGKRKVVKRQVDSLQAQVSLSAALPVAPQILGGVTFSKKRYKVANSIDHDSELAMNIAVAAVVLVYCETSNVHLNMHGAELLETLCVSFLNQMHCREYPTSFDNGTAEIRLQCWKGSTFLTPQLFVVSGSNLLRQASKLVTRLLENTKNITRDTKGKPVYWTLESVLQQCEEEALLPPKHNVHVSWHTLASKAPPLILAVGEIDPRLVTEGHCNPMHWLGGVGGGGAHKFIKKLLSLWNIVRSGRLGGGLVTNKILFNRWLQYATNLSSFRGRLVVTEDKAKTTVAGLTERTYRLIDVDENSVANLEENLFVGCCTCDQTADKQCLHYIQ